MRPLCSHGHAGPRRTGGRDCVSVTRGRRAGTRVLRPRAAAHRAWALMFGTYCTIGSFECRVERAPASASGRHADGGWCLVWGLRSRFRPRALFGVSWLTGAGALTGSGALTGAGAGASGSLGAATGSGGITSRCRGIPRSRITFARTLREHRKHTMDPAPRLLGGKC